MGNDHELTPKHLKPQSPNTIHSEVLRLGATTLLFHHLARLFASSIQLGYIPTAWKLATLRMSLKPDELPSLTTSYRPISHIGSIMNLFERVTSMKKGAFIPGKLLLESGSLIDAVMHTNL